MLIKTSQNINLEPFVDDETWSKILFNVKSMFSLYFWNHTSNITVWCDWS